MGLGSVLGAVIGGLLVGIVPSAVLKLGLGVILIVSVWRAFRHSQQPAVQTAGAPATWWLGGKDGQRSEGRG
jgi:uncharacterized membrane protein YfcA